VEIDLDVASWELKLVDVCMHYDHVEKNDCNGSWQLYIESLRCIWVRTTFGTTRTRTYFTLYAMKNHGFCRRDVFFRNDNE